MPIGEPGEIIGKGPVIIKRILAEPLKRKLLWLSEMDGSIPGDIGYFDKRTLFHL